MEDVDKNIDTHSKRGSAENSIKIIDYGVLFEFSFVLIIIAIDIPLIIIDINNMISSNSFYSFEFFRVFALIGVLIWLLYVFFIGNPQKFKKNKSYFLFNEHLLEYHHFGNTSITKPANIKVLLSEIDYIDFCIVSELQDRYARLNKLSSWQLYKKSSIGVHIGKAMIFLRYFLTYIFLIFPYKAWRLHNTKESFELFHKSLFICFKNRNYFLVNIYTKNDLKELVEFFSKNGVSIRGNLHFIPHLQNQGWFVDKEEKWSNTINIGDKNGK